MKQPAFSHPSLLLAASLTTVSALPPAPASGQAPPGPAEPPARVRIAPPPPVKFVAERGPAPAPGGRGGVAEGAASGGPYDIGNPSDEEQLFVELINRSRADADAEAKRLAMTSDPDILDAIRFFRVDLDVMKDQYKTLPQMLPPLSISKPLTDAARLHSRDMFEQTFQGHETSPGAAPPSVPGSSLGDRVSREGYRFDAVGENVYASAESVVEGHAAFEIDWGFPPMGVPNPPTHGMQVPPGHRNTIHDAGRADFREIGVGVVLGSRAKATNYEGPRNFSQNVGPMVVTQDFGTPASKDEMMMSIPAVPFITGVAYLDIDGDGFYGLGEGLGGVRVDAEGSDSFGITTPSGGYSVPVPGNGSYRVTFSGATVPEVSSTVTVAGEENVKLDFVPAYSPPAVTPPAEVFAGFANGFSFAPVVGATGYRLRTAAVTVGDVTEGAQSGEAGILITPEDPGYAVIQGALTAPGGGNRSFHFANPAFDDVAVELDRDLIPGPGTEVSWVSRMRFAFEGQVARVQVSLDGGASWSDRFDQAGATPQGAQAGQQMEGDASFVPHSFSLADLEGQTVRLRWVLDHVGGSVFTGTGSNVGWFVDNIAVTNVQELGEASETDFGAGETLSFTPGAPGEFVAQVAAINLDRVFPYGEPVPFTAVEGMPAPLELRLESIGRGAGGGGELTIVVEVGNGPASLLTLLEGDSPSSIDTDTGAAAADLGGGRMQFTVDPGAGTGRRFYRVRAMR